MSAPDAEQGLTAGGHRKLMVVVGDISADRHAARILERLKAIAPEIEIFGTGGDEMKAQGIELFYNCSDFAVLGIFEVINKLNFFYKMRQTLLAAVRDRKPDAVLLVDFGGFNIGFATALRKQNKDIPIYYFISPQVWGSRPWRINAMQKALSKMLNTFPFEVQLYLDKSLPARFVGNPIMHDLPDEEDLPGREEFIKAQGLDPSLPVIAVLPGSRRQEIKSHMPVLLSAIERLHALKPDWQFIISRSTDKVAPLIDDYIDKSRIKSLMSGTNKKVSAISLKPNYALYKNSDLVWAKSGTTTLEIMLFGRPMIIFYKGNFFSYLLVLLFKTVKNVGMPNILAGHQVVPELIQLDCRADQFVKYSLDLFEVPGLKADIERELLTLKRELGEGDYLQNCAEELLVATSGK